MAECLQDLVYEWDDKLERGEFSGDAAIHWREKLRSEGRAAIDKAIEHLSAGEEAAVEIQRSRETQQLTACGGTWSVHKKKKQV